MYLTKEQLYIKGIAESVVSPLKEEIKKLKLDIEVLKEHQRLLVTRINNLK